MRPKTLLQEHVVGSIGARNQRIHGPSGTIELPTKRRLLYPWGAAVLLTWLLGSGCMKMDEASRVHATVQRIQFLDDANKHIVEEILLRHRDDCLISIWHYGAHEKDYGVRVRCVASSPPELVSWYYRWPENGNVDTMTVCNRAVLEWRVPDNRAVALFNALYDLVSRAADYQRCDPPGTPRVKYCHLTTGRAKEVMIPAMCLGDFSSFAWQIWHWEGFDVSKPAELPPRDVVFFGVEPCDVASVSIYISSWIDVFDEACDLYMRASDVGGSTRTLATPDQ